MSRQRKRPAVVMQVLQQSWQRAWASLGTQPKADLFDRLVAGYNDPQRRYHTLQHLRECIEEFEPVMQLAEHPGEVEIALWFHDAVYDVKGHDNEQQSAALAAEALMDAGVSAESTARVFSLVMATRHSTLPTTADECLLVDIDLSILGAKPMRFREYEDQVRGEYGWVPEWLFQRKRKAILKEFLGRASIYSTEHFRKKYEASARENLNRSVS
jgi:predicted metal-dependent HD superfamily phosphohydrolase